MASPGKFRFPIYMRVGDHSPERQIGTVTFDPQETADAEAGIWRPQWAAILRAAADRIENSPPCDGGGPSQGSGG
ncbi:hypothetical protein QBA57_21310 [Streptomyces scabiei]|nr:MULTISPECIES: hypothetical protein [Streptomyces]MBP5862784.1 hypothetical protein [Streptomyces sp. LBUM 1484]MBP5876764.1 hypothetical protein [Streptomyces sp. LBUM 1477]MBP5884551.1 hypothetical protein [Streptomyces sp. LBUM 1487]QTU47604.1 hypothetical protein F3K20_24785 [Streptomyces sp. LBUM 1482]